MAKKIEVKTVSVVYRAPKGDSKVCEMFGFTFFDGVPVVIEDTPANAHAIAKLSKHKLFEMAEEGEVVKSAPPPEEPPPEPDPDDDVPDDDAPDPDPEPPEPEDLEEAEPDDHTEDPEPKASASAPRPKAKPRSKASRFKDYTPARHHR